MRGFKPILALAHVTCVIVAALPANAEGRPVTQGFSTAAVDRELFRDGEVRRRNERFAAWSLDCDEIPRLGQRYCSLRSMARDATGLAIAEFTLSTDENGKPAALIGLPFGIDLASPVAIEAAHSMVLGQPSAGLAASARTIAKSGKRTGAAKGAVATAILRFTVRPAVCDRSGCQIVLALKPADIAALRAGTGLKIRFTASGRDGRGFTVRSDAPSRPIEGVIVSEGFGEALEASIR